MEGFPRQIGEILPNRGLSHSFDESVLGSCGNVLLRINQFLEYSLVTIFHLMLLYVIRYVIRFITIKNYQ